MRIIIYLTRLFAVVAVVSWLVYFTMLEISSIDLHLILRLEKLCELIFFIWYFLTFIYSLILERRRIKSRKELFKHRLLSSITGVCRLLFILGFIGLIVFQLINRDFRFPFIVAVIFPLPWLVVTALIISFVPSRIQTGEPNTKTV